MHPSVLKYLIEPGSADQGALRLDTFQEADGHVMEGVLVGAGGDWYPILSGVPCFVRGECQPDLREFAARHGLHAPPHRPDTPTARSETVGTFSEKWRRFRRYGLEPSHQEFLIPWYCRKLGLDDRAALEKFIARHRMILEVGPGSGFMSRFMAECTTGQVIAADISEGAQVTFENVRTLPNCHAVQADLMDLPLPDQSCDFIIADGVLHHTPNTKAALAALYRKLKPGGEMFFYVYRRMGAARQFCDQHIRAAFSSLTPEACFDACEGLTKLGRELSRVKAEIHLDEPIDVLGIPAGTHDVQRLLYYNFVKCFWNEAFDFETNNMVNYDWYHPSFAWQHSEEEVAGWLRELGVSQYRFHPANPNGISTLLTKPRSV